MIILGLRLKNIRSYTDKTVVLPKEGITVIYGDIGTGKSTILSSITYALFGQPRARITDPMQRYAYPKGEDLLRLGAHNGYVRLLIQQKNRLLLVERGLYRKSDGRIGDSGGRLVVYEYVEGNGEEKIRLVHNRLYSSEELRIKVLEFLGLPEIISRQKPLVFTNTIYVPQFSMNEIINLDDNERIRLINKALNIDKYNTIKKNLDKLNDRILRNEIKVLERQEKTLEPIIKQVSIEELEKKIKELTLKIAEAEERLEKIDEQLVAIDKQLREYEDLLENKRREYEKLLSEYRVLEEKKKQYARKTETVMKQIESLGISDLSQVGTVRDKLRKQIEQIDEKISLLNNKKNELNNRRRELQAKIDEINTSINKLKEEIGKARGLIEAENTILEKKQKELREKEELVKKGICPVCGQNIPHEHGQRLITRLRGEIESIKKEIEKYRREIESVEKQKSILEHNRRKLEEELKTIDELITRLDKEKDDLHRQKIDLVTKLNLLSSIEELERELETLRKEIEEIPRIEEELRRAGKELDEINAEISRLRKKKDELTGEKTRIVGEKASYKSEIKTLRERVEQARKYLEQLQEIKKEKAKLEKARKFLIGDRGRTGLFYELVNTIEDRVRSVAYSKFRRLFIEYFLKLMEDHEIIEVDLDEKFKPVFRLRANRLTGEIALPSGGQLTSVSLAYRLALNAVARAMTPQLKNSTLILDEPTYGFSPERVEKLRELLSIIGGKRQIIIVTHDPNLLDVGDCRIRLNIDGANMETVVDYEECRNIEKEYYEYVKDMLTSQTKTPSRPYSEESSEGLKQGFRPDLRGSGRKGRGREKSIFDYIG